MNRNLRKVDQGVIEGWRATSQIEGRVNVSLKRAVYSVYSIIVSKENK